MEDQDANFITRRSISRNGVVSLVGLLLLICSCKESTISEGGRPQAQTVVTRGISVEELSNTLTTGLTPDVVVSKLGKPTVEHISSDGLTHLMYETSITSLKSAPSEQIMGFRVTFTNEHLVFWQLTVVDSTLTTNQLYFADPPPKLKTLEQLSEKRMPIHVFIEPELVKITNLKFQAWMKHSSPELVITAALARVVQEEDGRSALRIELDDAESERLSQFMNQNRDRVAIFATGGIPLSRIILREPMSYYRFVLPFNIE